MKSKLLILFLFASQVILGQQPFYDAVLLEKYWSEELKALDFSSKESEIILPILYQYLDSSVKSKISITQNQIDELELEIDNLQAQRLNSNTLKAKVTKTKIDSLNAVKTYLTGTMYDELKFSFVDAKNPFIHLPETLQSSDVKNFNTTSKSVLNKIGGLNVTSLADGLAKFLVERTKQELSISFFQKFNKMLEEDDNKDLAKLFPQTFSVLNVIDAEIYQYSHYLNTLQEAFKKDLENILVRLEPFLVAKKLDLYSLDENDPVAQKIEYFESSLLLINNLRQGVHPAEAIGKLEFQSYHPQNTTLVKIKEGVKLFNIFSNSLRSKDVNRYWVEPKEMQSLLDTSTFKIYLGLLYQLHGDKTIFENKFSAYLNEAAENVELIDNYRIYVQSLILDGDKISIALQNIKQRKKNGETVDSYQELFQSTLNFLKNFKETDQLNLNVNLEDSSKVWEVFDLLNEVYLDVNEARYNALILDLSNLLTVILEPQDFVWKNNLVKYGTFIANVAQADDSEEVQAAIEAIALPVGSATIKRRSEFNVALNAYVGLSPAMEYNGDTKDTKFSLGINAPVGLAASWGLKGKKKEHGSISIFVPIIDIGAVTNFRFGDDMTEELPEIKLQNIFAPGLYLVHGWANLPISWGIGGQFGPQLRDVNATELTLNSDPSFSVRAFLAVDIPLLNFYTRSR